MTDVVMATDEADATAVDAIEQHHAELAGGLAHRVRALVGAASRGDADAAVQARDELAGWCRTELVPHAEAEEGVLYPPAQERGDARLLVRAMLAEHRVIVGLVQRVAVSAPVEAAAAGTALQVLFDSHARKENELLLPVLAQDPAVSLATLLEGMHAQLTATPRPAAADAGSHTCGCHETDDEVPELDARSVPHAIRHATVFGALDGVAPGRGLVLVAPHDPLPLLAQIAEREPGAFTVDYLERGPEAWRLQFTRGTGG